jgi:hypothetical protein
VKILRFINELGSANCSANGMGCTSQGTIIKLISRGTKDCEQYSNIPALLSCLLLTMGPILQKELNGKAWQGIGGLQIAMKSNEMFVASLQARVPHQIGPCCHRAHQLGLQHPVSTPWKVYLVQAVKKGLFQDDEVEHIIL